MTDDPTVPTPLPSKDPGETLRPDKPVSGFPKTALLRQ
jgi:hypothetical protein